METIDEILREMRECGKRHWLHDEWQSARMFADRIEAAVKEERKHWAEQLSDTQAMLGNALKTLRTALDCKLYNESQEVKK